MTMNSTEETYRQYRRYYYDRMNGKWSREHPFLDGLERYIASEDDTTITEDTTNKTDQEPPLPGCSEPNKSIGNGGW